jgi:hypothetical protein
MHEDHSHADHLKLMFPMAWTITTLAWSIIDGQDMLQTTRYDGRSNHEWAMQTLQYGAEFLLKCSFADGEFVIQVRLETTSATQMPVHTGAVVMSVGGAFCSSCFACLRACWISC